MIFEKIINLGVTPNMEFYKKREVRIVNLFAIISLVGLIVGVTILALIKSEYSASLSVFTIIMSSLILVFNYKGWNEMATHCFIIPININIFILCLQYSEKAGNYQFYFLVIFCVAVLHHSKQSNWRTIFFFSITIISFLATKFVDNTAFLLPNVTDQEEHVLLFYNQTITITISIVLVYLLIIILNKQNQETLDLLAKEKCAQVNISQSLKEKEVLLAEIQHRVKNNLAVISGLLSLQADKAPCEESKSLMLESKNRVLSMALVHGQLYKTKNLSNINFKIYLSTLVPEIVKSFPESAQQIYIEQQLDDVELDITKAVPVGLIVNEVITNSFKHAFDKSICHPLIRITMSLINNIVTITLSDNGVGNTLAQNTKNKTTLGLSLIESLADQIDGTAEYNYDHGTSLKLVFNL